MRNEERSKTAYPSNRPPKNFSGRKAGTAFLKSSIDIGRPVRMKDGTAFAVGIRQSGSFQRGR